MLVRCKWTIDSMLPWFAGNPRIFLQHQGPQAGTASLPQRPHWPGTMQSCRLRRSHPPQSGMMVLCRAGSLLPIQPLQQVPPQPRRLTRKPQALARGMGQRAEAVGGLPLRVQQRSMQHLRVKRAAQPMAAFMALQPPMMWTPLQRRMQPSIAMPSPRCWHTIPVPYLLGILQNVSARIVRALACIQYVFC